MKNNIKLSFFIFILVYFISLSSTAQIRYLDYLSENGFKSKELKSFRELDEYTNKMYIDNKLTDNEVVFVKINKIIQGVVFGNEYLPRFFVTDSNSLTLFITDPTFYLTDEDLFGFLLSNFHSASYYDFKENKFFHIFFNYAFSDVLPIIEEYQIKGSTYNMYIYNGEKKIKYPIFLDTLNSCNEFNLLEKVKLKKRKKVKKNASIFELSKFSIDIFNPSSP